VKILFIFYIFIIFIGCGDTLKREPTLARDSNISKESIFYNGVRMVIREEIIGVGYIEYIYDRDRNLIEQKIVEIGE